MFVLECSCVLSLITDILISIYFQMLVSKMVNFAQRRKVQLYKKAIAQDTTQKILIFLLVFPSKPYNLIWSSKII